MRKRIPVGLKDYEKLKSENYYVVDKTLMIKDFLEQIGRASCRERV